MDRFELSRWGYLLDTLSEMSDVERQLVVQNYQPGVFVPIDLLDQWDSYFQGGYGLHRIGVADHMIALLLEFDSHLDELIDYLPENADDKEDYIRHNEAWQAVCELADWTLARVEDFLTPEELMWGRN